MNFPILSSLILLPSIGAFFILFTRSSNEKYQSCKYVALFISLANFLISASLLKCRNKLKLIKGASSVLSGSSALSGAIHIRTAYPRSKPLTKVNIYNGFYSSPSVEGAKWWSGVPLISGANFLHSRQINSTDVVIGGNLNYDHGYIGPPIPSQFVTDTVSNFTNEQMSSK